jgi:hypothetical protein
MLRTRHGPRWEFHRGPLHRLGRPDPQPGEERETHPRVRGEQPPRKPNVGGARWSIPACAGSRASDPAHPALRRVHPRVRGDQAAIQSMTPTEMGPSPRARGAAHEDDSEYMLNRSIPACAGSSSHMAPGLIRQEVHPRVRGEQGPVLPNSRPAGGPSPRARGADSLTWQLTSGKQPFLQLPEKQTKPAPLAPSTRAPHRSA